MESLTLQFCVAKKKSTSVVYVCFYGEAGAVQAATLCFYYSGWHTNGSTGHRLYCELGGKQHVCTLSTWSGFIWHTNALRALIWQIGNLVTRTFKGARASLGVISLAEMNLGGQNRSTTVVDMMGHITFWRKQRTPIQKISFLCIDSFIIWVRNDCYNVCRVMKCPVLSNQQSET